MTLLASLLPFLTSHQTTLDVGGRLPSAAVLRRGEPSPSLDAHLLDASVEGGGVFVTLEDDAQRLVFLFDTGSGESHLRPSLPVPPRLRLLPQEETLRFSRDLPERVFDDLSRVKGSRVDGILGREAFEDRAVGIDLAARTIAILPQSDPEVSDLWFRSLLTRCGGKPCSIPWSPGPREIRPDAVGPAPATIAAIDTIRVRSVRLDSSGRALVTLRSGARAWEAIVDTGSTVTVAPPDVPAKTRGEEVQVLTGGGAERLRPVRSDLRLASFSIRDFDYYASKLTSSEFTLGLDVLGRAKWLIDFSEGSLEVSPYVSSGLASPESDTGSTKLYHVPSRRWVVLTRPASFPYEPGWFAIRGKVEVREGVVHVNGD